ncbi:MAG: transporter substrate-binding domain-containing protein [Bermanella sp.]
MKTLVLFLSLIVLPICHGAPLKLITEELPPYAYREGGKITGASVDIIKALFKQANISYQIKMFPWKRAYETAKSESACIFPIQRSQEREVLFNWISPVLITQTAFYANDSGDHQVRTLTDALKLKIGTYRGSAVEEYLTGQGFKVTSVSKDSVNANKLSFERIDLWAADTLSAPYFIKKANITNIKEALVYFTTLRALACNPAVPATTISKLQDALQAIYNSGEVDKILAKYKQ